MKNRRFVQRDIAKKIPNVKRYVRIPAFMGDGAGNFDVSGKPGYVYIRYRNGQLWTAYNAANAPKRDDTKIWVGTSQDFPLRLVVLGLGDVYDEPSWSSQEIDTSSLIWPGANTLFIHPEQFTKFLVMPDSGFTVQVFGGAFANLDGTAGRVANQLVDISSYQPAAGAVWIVLQYNSAGVVSIVEGATVAAKALLTLANIPAVTNNPMAAIKLYDGQTQTNRDPNGINDYVDLRFGGVPVHAHDAHDLPYTPNSVYDWDCALDPGDVGDGLDQLAARIVPLEATPPGTWDGDLTDLDETSSADIGEALADADQGIIYNASAAAWVRFAFSRLKTYIQALTDTLYMAIGADYSDISTNDVDTDVTGAELEALTDGSNGSAVLASAFSLTAASGTFEDTGVSIALPVAGTYLIDCDVRGVMEGDAGTLWWIVSKLYNSTDAADVTNSETMIVLTGTTGLALQNTATVSMIVTVAAAKTIKLYASRNAAGTTPTFTDSRILSDANGRTRMRYKRIA